MVVVRGEFTLEVAPPDGVPVAGQAFLEEFAVDILDTKVEVSAERGTSTFGLDPEDPGTVECPVLKLLKAQVIRDVGNPDMDRSTRENLFVNPAVRVLVALARHIRTATRDIAVDVHAKHLTQRYCFEDGSELPWWYTHEVYLDWSLMVEPLSKDMWKNVVKAVAAGRAATLADDLLLDAQALLHEKDTRSAMISAAVACEALLSERVVESLLGLGGITPGAAKKLADQVSKRELPRILGCFYEISSEEIDNLYKVFDIRNNLLHNPRGRPPTDAVVQDAVDLGLRLQKLGPKSEGGSLR